MFCSYFESHYTVLGNLKIDLKDDEDLSHSTVDSILHKLRRLVGLFNKSTILNEELLKAQQPINSTPKKGIKVKLLRLIQDVKTRWNSLYLMGKRYLALIKPLDKVFAEQNEGYKHKNKNLTPEEQE